MDKLTSMLNRAVGLLQILARIKEEGLPEKDVEEMSLVLDALVKKTGMSVPKHATPTQKGKIILSSSLSREEKVIAGPITMCLSAHLKFQRDLLAQQRQDFQAGNNKIVFFHPVTGKKIGPFDKKTLDVIHRTRAMMLFPEQEKRTIREKLIRASDRNLRLAPDEKTAGIASKRYLRMSTVGVVFKIQCEHWIYAQKMRSLNVIMAANEKGFFHEWEKVGIHVGTARKYMKDFAPVRHLLAADYALTRQDKDENPGAHQAGAFTVPFISFLVGPARFFLAADRYREWAKEAGLITSKKELWMPEGWKDLVRDVPPLEVGDFTSASAEEIRRFDAFEKEYKDDKGWMKE